MPESTCLHIQDHESGPIRVVDIPWISVRIGRAAFCEVQADLGRPGRRSLPAVSQGAVVASRARRRQGQDRARQAGPSTAACALPFDVPFRVGRHCLTLRQDRAVDPDWEMYPGPAPADRNRTEHRTKAEHLGRVHGERTATIIESQPTAEASLKPDWRPHETTKRPGPTGEYAAAASVKDRWETRWRAAGAEFKARGDRSRATHEPKGPDFKTGFDSVPIKEAPVPRVQPVARPRVEPPPPRPIPTTRPIPTSTRVAPVEPSSPIVIARLKTETGQHHEPPAESHYTATPEPYVAPSEPRDRPGEGEAPPAPASSLDSHGGSSARNVSEEPAQSMAPASALEEIDTGPEEKPIADESSYTTSQLDDEPYMAADEMSWYEAPALPPPRQSRPPRQNSSSRKRTVKEAHSPDSDRAKHAVSRGKKGAEGRSVASPQPRKGGETRPVAENRPEPESSLRFTQMPSAKEILATYRSTAKSLPTSLPAQRPVREAGPTLARAARPMDAAGLDCRSAGGGVSPGFRTGRGHPVMVVDGGFLLRRHHDPTLDGRRSKARARPAARFGRAT